MLARNNISDLEDAYPDLAERYRQLRKLFSAPLDTLGNNVTDRNDWLPASNPSSGFSHLTHIASYH